jgi:MFS family permease
MAAVAPPDAPTGLWRHGDFNRLWAGQTVSIVGSGVTTLALPSLAVLQLHASPLQVGLLAACQRFAFPILALPVGVLADRVSRRRLMLRADIVRCALLGSIPLLAALGVLRLWELYVLAALTGGFAVVFDLAYMSYVPTLVGRAQLADATARLEFSNSAGDVGGPGIGGLLVQALGAARAVSVDAASFLLSAVMLLLIGRREPPAVPRELAPFSVRQMRTEIGEGLRIVAHTPVLRSLVLCMAPFIFWAHGIDAIFIVFAYRTLHLSPGLVGIVLTANGLGSIGGAALAGPMRRRLGVGRLIVVTGVVTAATLGAIPLSQLGAPIAVLMALAIVRGATGTANNVTQFTVRLLATPDRLHARMNAVFRMLYWGAWPLGELCGGALGSTFGVSRTIVLAGVLALAPMVWCAFTPVGRLRAFPSPPA